MPLGVKKCTFAKRKAFWGGLGSREPEGPGLLARLWMKEEPSRPFPLRLRAGKRGGGRVREEGHMPRVCAEKRLHGM